MEAKVGEKSSWGWKGMLQARKLLGNGLRWRVGNGAHIRIWEDPWLPKPTTFKPRALNGRQYTKVKELLIGDGGEWNVKVLQQVFQNDDVEIIRKMPVSGMGCEDRRIWHYTRTGDYSVKSGYQVEWGRGVFEEDKRKRDALKYGD